MRASKANNKDGDPRKSSKEDPEEEGKENATGEKPDKQNGGESEDTSLHSEETGEDGSRRMSSKKARADRDPNLAQEYKLKGEGKPGETASSKTKRKLRGRATI